MLDGLKMDPLQTRDNMRWLVQIRYDIGATSHALVPYFPFYTFYILLNCITTLQNSLTTHIIGTAIAHLKNPNTYDFPHTSLESTFYKIFSDV